MTPKEYYKKNIEELSIEIKDLAKKLNYISAVRLACAALFITSAVYLFKHGEVYLWVGTIASLIVFLFFVKLSIKLKEKRKFAEELLQINGNEIKALHGDYSPFDSGEELINPAHAFSYDLDIFGDSSIFQVLNRTSTFAGKQMLAGMLNNPNIEVETIIEKQAAILELKDKVEFRQAFQANGQLINESESDQKEIEHWLAQDNKFVSEKKYKLFIQALPPATLVSLGLSIFGLIPSVFPWIFASIQLFTTLLNFGYINKRHHKIHKSISTLKKFHKLINVIENEEFQSKGLSSIKSKTYYNDAKPSDSFSKLIRLVNALDNRMNIVVALFLNAVFLWDIKYMYKIGKWSEEFREVFPIWVEAIAKFDALSSLSNFMYNNPKYVIPELSNSPSFTLDILEGGHPLLDGNEMVTNNIHQNEDLNLFLITGANMAGKSTFLRTVGVNLVLAMTGTCVCAKRFIFTPVRLYSSMRSNDSLQENTSFFFAELKRLKFIIDQLKKGGKSYILLDEILKGTNSKDQHTGSTRLIENIIELNGKGMIATHDIELTKLGVEHPNKVKNIAFEIEMEEDKMIFDYRYKEGVCQNMNATILMEQMSIFN